MKKNLSIFITPGYIKKLEQSKPGTKVIMHLPKYLPNLTIGGDLHGRKILYKPSELIQKKWVGILEHGDGYIIGKYVFEIVKDDYVSYNPWNKPK